MPQRSCRRHRRWHRVDWSRPSHWRHGASTSPCSKRRDAPGGKMRQIAIGPAQIDGGPTVFTMRWVFDELFAAAGKNLSDHVRLQPLEMLARHAWDEDARLDLFADDRTHGRCHRRLRRRGRSRRLSRLLRATPSAIYETLEEPFLRGAAAEHVRTDRRRRFPRPDAICRRSRRSPRCGRRSGEYFRDPRLRQLFGRYATYCGSSPFSRRRR